MKKPQCEKPTAYNCGNACINVAKSCNQSPSDSMGRSRLQKLKQLAVIFSKSKSKNNQKSRESTDRLIQKITKKRQVAAKEISESRTEINAVRRRARLKAEAKGKREQLLKMYDDFGNASTTGGRSSKILDMEAPEREIKKRVNKYKKQASKLLETDPQESQRVTKGALNMMGKIDAESSKFLEETRALVQVNKPTKLNSSIKSGTPQAHQKGVEVFQKMISIPDLNDPVNIVEAPPERKGRSCYISNTNNVYMGNDDPAVVIHEMSHWLEEKVPGVRQEVQEFYNKRTQGENLVKLSEVTGNGNYGDNEVTKVDKWLNPYMGKEYKNASEILSMGMEIMYRNPAYLAKNDPEMFDFIYSVVRRG